MVAHLRGGGGAQSCHVFTCIVLWPGLGMQTGKKNTYRSTQRLQQHLIPSEFDIFPFKVSKKALFHASSLLKRNIYSLLGSIVQLLLINYILT